MDALNTLEGLWAWIQSAEPHVQLAILGGTLLLVQIFVRFPLTPFLCDKAC